jgi:acetylornithine deacetylase/succinyl-diaminopimelate desuccinylase-like protein
MKATLRGPGGHGSIPISGGAMAKLARMLDTLDKNRLPVKITPVVREMVQAMAAALPDPTASSMHALLDPATTDAALAELGPAGRIFQPIVRNTVNATIVHGGEKINVIPGEIVVQMDGRLLPGDTSNDMIAQLRDLIGNEPELELIDYDPFNAEPDMSMFDTLSGILRETDPDAVPVPFLLSGFTDGRHFARLGIQTYGFLPMDLPQGFNSTQTIHAADERIPAEAVEFGANAIYKLLQRFGDRS